MTSSQRLTARRPSGIERAARGVLASAALAMLLVGLPWGLIVCIGWPLPTHIPDLAELRALLLNPLSARMLLDVLACLLWPAWACFAWQVTRCVPAAFRTFPAPALPGRVSPLHAVATILVGMVAASIIGSRAPTGILPNTAPAGAARPLANIAAPQIPGPAVDLVTVRQPAGGVHDSLWRIAQRHLGDGSRWPEIWRRNAGVTQPDGRVFNHPNFIQPGWVLRLSAPNRPAVSRTPATASHKHPSIEQHRLNPPPVTPQATSHPGHGISTTTGAYVGSGLAAAVVGALIAARRRRRRAYEPGSGVRGDLTVAPIVRALAAAANEETQSLGVQPSGAPALAQHATPVEAGEQDGRTVAIDLARTRGLGLVGPGADDAARALLVSLLADARLGAAELVITTEQAAALLGDKVRWSALSGLRVVSSLRHALDHLEAELLTRVRRAADPDTHGQRPGTLALVAASDTDEERRLQGVLDNGSTVGFAGILIGQWRPGGTIHVRADGTVAAISPELTEPLANTRLFTLPTTDASALADLLLAASGTPTEPATKEPASLSLQQPAMPPTAAVVEPRPAPKTPRPKQAVLMLNVLGRFRLEDTRQEPAIELADSLPRKQREILTYLALHPGGVRRELFATAIWPEAPGDRPYNSFHATLSQLRRTLRDAAPEFAQLVRQHDGHYSLDADLATVDLWRLTRCLTIVRDAADGQQRHDALSEALDLHAGDLADGLTGEWLEAPREALRRDLLDAISTVVRNIRSNEPERALALLEHARTLDPYNEAIYRELARLQALLGRIESIPRTLGLLGGALAEIDQRPADDTIALCEALQRRGGTDVVAE